MQVYKPNLDSPTPVLLSQLIEAMNNNFESLRSNFSGTLEPSEFIVGQFFYNNILNKLYFKSVDGYKIIPLTASGVSASGVSASGVSHNHSNKVILDAVTAAFTTNDRSKLNGIQSSAVSLQTVKSDSEIANAVSKTHAHSNKSVLDNITALGNPEEFLAGDGTYKMIQTSGVSGASIDSLKKFFLI